MTAVSGLLVREAVPADLGAIVALQREDVIREVHEDDVPVSAYRAAFDEITDDPRQQLLVGELDGEVVATAQRTAARRFYDRLGFTASHVGMKYYLGGER